MQQFLLRRVVIAIVTIMAVSLIIFVMSRAAGDPRALLLDDYSTMDDWDNMGAALGLDKPYYCPLYISDAADATPCFPPPVTLNNQNT